MVSKFHSNADEKLPLNQKKDKKLEKLQRRIDKLEEELRLIVAENVLITVNQAAEIRNVSRAAIADLIRRGRIRAIEVLDTTKVFYEDIENLTPQKPGPKRGGKIATPEKSSAVKKVKRKKD